MTALRAVPDPDLSECGLSSGPPSPAGIATRHTSQRHLFGDVWHRDTDSLPADWATAIHEFADHLRSSRRTEATAYGYARNARTLAAHCAGLDLGPWSVTPSDLDHWLTAGHWSRTTRHRLATAVRTFYSWAVAEGRLGWSPAAGLGANDHRAPGPAPNDLPPLWREPVAAFVVHLRAGGRAEGTILRYRERLAGLSQHAADPWSLEPEQLEQWIGRPDWSPETKRAALSVARRFYAWGERSHRISQSPATYLPAVRTPRAMPRPIPTEALRSGLADADDRLRLILILGALAGLRRAEIAGLRWSDVEQGRSVIVRGKGGNERRVPLLPDLAAELTAEWSRRLAGGHGSGFSGPYLTPDGYLFASPDHPGPITPRHLGRIASRALPDGWTLHTLRHRFASQAFSAQRDLRAVQELLGHSKPETTARYVGVPGSALVAAVAGVGLDLPALGADTTSTATPPHTTSTERNHR